MKNIYVVFVNSYDNRAVDSIYSTYQFATERINELYKQFIQKYIDSDQEGTGYQVQLENNEIRISFEGSVVVYSYIKQMKIER